MGLPAAFGLGLEDGHVPTYGLCYRFRHQPREGWARRAALSGGNVRTPATEQAPVSLHGLLPI